jgi:pyrroloquinoline quinone biosynthesis protein B
MPADYNWIAQPGDLATFGGITCDFKPHAAVGHLPIGGTGGSLEQLSGLPIERTIYIHMNNTNPVLLEDSPERRMVTDRGVEVAVDGLEVKV